MLGGEQPGTVRVVPLLQWCSQRRDSLAPINMNRKLPEWVGLNDNTKIPPRVRLRVADASDGRCKQCGVRISRGGQIDHVTALANWRSTAQAPHGNREGNLQLLCKACHDLKSNRDVSDKSRVYKKKLKLGPLQKDRSTWSKKLTDYKWNWKKGRYEK